MSSCKIDGCARERMYTEQGVCQMHYFRFMRTGQYDLVRRGHKPRQENPQGYQWIYEPAHPLRHKNGGYVAEHRAVLYAAIGPDPMACELCGIGLTWKTCKVDHIDTDVRNNERSNLRPTCNSCNTRRAIRAPVEWDKTHKIAFNGEVKTPAEWARDPRVNISGHQIILRKASGMTDEQALFAPKRTHNGKPPPAGRGKGHKHIHLTVDGLTLTMHEWSGQPGVNISSRAIALRLKRGFSHRDAIFTPRENLGSPGRPRKSA
jgi:hypothetical protein